MLAAFERGLGAALEDVVADPKKLKGEGEAEAWLRRRLEGPGKGRV